MPTLKFDIWSDIACPWCYIGKRRLERALAVCGAHSVDVTWHAFELNPAAPAREDTGDYAGRLAKKYRTTDQEAQRMIDRVKDVAGAEGLNFDFVVIRPGNTFDAHRVLCMARELGIQSAVKERFMRAYFCEGELISDHATLTRLAAEAGLEEGDVQRTLCSNAYVAKVRDDEALASELGISGVPFYVLNNQYGVSGAQPPEVLLKVIEEARQANGAEQVTTDGAHCGPHAC